MKLASTSAAIACGMLLGTLAFAAATVTVKQIDKAFDKTSISIKVGDTVDFTNADTVAHNIMSRSADPFNLGIMKVGETKSRKFDHAGTFEVVCALHPRMKLSVDVK